MKRVTITLLLLVLFFSADQASADLPVCPDGTPVARVTIELYSIDAPCNGGSQQATSPIPLNCPFSVNVTPRNADNTCDALGSRQLQFQLSSNLQKLNRGGNTFVPWFRGTSNGGATIAITLDGITSNILSFFIGTATGPLPSISGGPVPSVSRRPGDPGEEDTLCAYRSGTALICVPGTENARTDAQCIPDPTCRAKGPCVVTERSVCVSPSPSSTNLPITQAAPGDLGALIKKVFDFSLSIVGIVVFVMAVYGGFLMLLAGASPALHSKGRQQIMNAFLGALLLFAAYVILNTINPDFVSQRGGLPPIGTITPPPPR